MYTAYQKLLSWDPLLSMVAVNVVRVSVYTMYTAYQKLLSWDPLLSMISVNIVRVSVYAMYTAYQKLLSWDPLLSMVGVKVVDAGTTFTIGDTVTIEIRLFYNGPKVQSGSR